MTPQALEELSAAAPSGRVVAAVRARRTDLTVAGGVAADGVGTLTAQERVGLARETLAARGAVRQAWIDIHAVLTVLALAA